MLNPGDKAPDFSLPDQDGKPVSLKDFEGKWLVLYFYPKDMTPGCTTEACNFQEALPDLHDLRAAVVGVSKDSVARHRKFADKYTLQFTLLSAEESDMIERYGAWQEKNLYGRKYMGIVRMTYIIDPQGRVARVFPRVKAGVHADEVRRALEELRGETAGSFQADV